LTDEHQEPTTGGLVEAPRSVLRPIVRLVVVLGIVVVGGSLIVLFAARLPQGTSPFSLIVRGAVGLSIGLALIYVVRRMLGALTEPPPAPPQRFDARATDVIYECPVCGTRLRLEVAATTKAPRHCGEEMEASVATR
jgi:hypothetical protein